MTLTVSGQAFALDPATSGLTVDPASAVAARGHRDPTPAGLWKALFAHPKLNLAVSVDNAKLDAAVTALNSKIVGGGHDGSIEFHGTTPVAIAPVTGSPSTHDQAVAAIKAAYLTSTAPVALPVETIQPSVTAAAVQTALTTIAQPAVASPIALVVGTNTVQPVASSDRGEPHVPPQRWRVAAGAQQSGHRRRSRVDGVCVTSDAEQGRVLRRQIRHAGADSVGRGRHAGSLETRLFDLSSSDPARTANDHSSGEGRGSCFHHGGRAEARRQGNGEHVHDASPVLCVAGDEHPHDREHRQRRDRDAGGDLQLEQVRRAA